MNNMDLFSSLNKNLNTTNPLENTTININNFPVDDHREESGWTSYFEDFSNYVHNNNNNNNNNIGREDEEYGQSFSCYSTDHHQIGSPSMVSDAASFPARKPSSQPNNNHHQHLVSDHSSLGASPPNIPTIRRLKFRKTRTNEIISHDDSLEDTASSPVNSPKVSDFGAGGRNPAGRAGNDHFSISSLGKGSSIDHDYGRKEADKLYEMGFSGKIINDHPMELKKRGLCLLPVSMLVNYLG